MPAKRSKPKRLTDLTKPRSKDSDDKGIQQLHYTSFVIGQPNSPESMRIDRELKALFERINQNQSQGFDSPHARFLQQALLEFAKRRDASMTVDRLPESWTMTLSQKQH